MKRYLVFVVIYLILIALSLVSTAYLEVIYYILFLMVISQSLNILMGFGGLYNFGHAVFIGIGAYAFALLVVQGINPYISMIAGGVLSSVVALLIGMVTLRLRGPYFAICTLAIVPAIKYLIIGGKIAGGAAGIVLLRYLIEAYNPYILSYILLSLSIIITILTLKISTSPLGYSLKALREDHDAALTSGVDATRCRVIAFILSALFPGVAGGVVAFKIFWVMPETVIDLTWSVEAILIVLLGGSGTVTGPIIGALIYEALKDLLMRYFPGLQLLIFGLLVVALISVAPEGIVGLLGNRFKKLRRILI